MTTKICRLASIAILLQLSPTVSFSSTSISDSNIQCSHNRVLSTKSSSQCLSFNTKSRRTGSSLLRRASSFNGVNGESSSAISSDRASSNKAKLLEAMKAEFDDTGFLVQFELPDHKPLGCTVEETVVHECNHVFVSKLVPGGFASQAGLQAGDVLLATNGMFGDDDVTIVVNSGVDKIKSLIGSIPEDRTLHLAIARGTSVMEKHEECLVELCSSNGPSDKQIEGSIQKFLSDGYYSDVGEMEEEEDVVLDAGDSLVANIYDIWAEELPPPPPISENLEQPRETAEKIKPWSSRSSPSGTFVRDPVTGEMKNIDSTDWSNGLGSS